MKINDVVTLMEYGAFGPPGSRAMGNANFALLSRHYTKPASRTSANLVLNFGAGPVELSDADVNALAKYYDTLPTDADRIDFVYDVMSQGNKFETLLNQLGLRKPPPPPIPTSSQSSMDLSERDSKKNPSTDLDRSSVRSAGLSTALRQAYAKYPQAQSDIEALVMHDMDVQKNTGQEIQSQIKVNQRQDDVDVQLRDVNRQQSKKISSLDNENDALSAELDRLSQELDAMYRQTGAEPKPKKDTDSSEKSDTDTVPRDYGSGNVGSVARAEKTQKRAADAEKRKPEPEAPKLRPGSSTFKPVGSTLATVPMVKPPAPTIDVIDRPDPSAAMSQMAQSLSDPAKSPVIGQTAQSLIQPPAKEPIITPDQALPTQLNYPDPDVGAPSAYSAARSAEEEPDNVFQFPGTRKPAPADADQGSFDFDVPDELARQRQTAAQLRRSSATQARNTIRDTAAAAMLEAQTLRRMRELAGITR